MMLYHLDDRMVSKNHWTEIYVIITVTTMFFEEVRAVKEIDRSSTRLKNFVSLKGTA